MQQTAIDPRATRNLPSDERIFQRVANLLVEEGFSVAEAKRRVISYRQFWELKRRFPAESVLVSAEIDEVWHLHLRDEEGYAADCLEFFGGFLPHIPEQQVSASLVEQSARLWRQTFGKVPRLRPICNGAPIVYGNPFHGRCEAS